MCRAVAEGGRRCPGHGPAARVADYQASKVRASDDPGVHRDALRSGEPKVVAAGAEKITGSELAEVIETAGLAGYEVLDSHDPEVALAAARDTTTGTRVLRALLHHADPRVRYSALVTLDAQGEVDESVRRWIDEQDDDRYLRLALFRGPAVALAAQDSDEEDARHAAEREREELEADVWARQQEIEELRVERRREQAERVYRQRLERDVRRLHGAEGWQRWQVREEEVRIEQGRSGLAIWRDGDEEVIGSVDEYQSFLDRQRELEAARARGLASNPETPETAVQALAADPDATTSRRAVAELARRGVRRLWARIAPRRRRSRARRPETPPRPRDEVQRLEPGRRPHHLPPPRPERRPMGPHVPPVRRTPPVQRR